MTTIDPPRTFYRIRKTTLPGAHYYTIETIRTYRYCPAIIQGKYTYATRAEAIAAAETMFNPHHLREDDTTTELHIKTPNLEAPTPCA